MKSGVLLLVLLSSLMLGSNLAQAGDQPCQFDLLKPKIQAATIKDELNQPSQFTANDIKSRLAQKQQAERPGNEKTGKKQQNAQTTDTNKEQTESTSKTSRLGGIFDILLPAALRNPVK